MWWFWFTSYFGRSKHNQCLGFVVGYSWIPIKILHIIYVLSNVSIRGKRTRVRLKLTFSMVLTAFNNYKFIKREKTRFFDLSESIKYINDLEFTTNLLILFNSLLNTENLDLYDQLKVELINLQIVEDLRLLDINDETFTLQLKILMEELSTGVDDLFNDSPKDILEKLNKKIPQDSKKKLLKIMNYFLNITYNEDEKAVEENWENLLYIVENSINNRVVKNSKII
jgi:hypothetical protein